MTQNNIQREAPILEFWGSVECPVIDIISTSTQTQSESICLGSMYGSNNFLKNLFVSDRNTCYPVTMCKNSYKTMKKYKYKHSMNMIS